jgi:DNA-binding CsgD family transcriptional regulator/PAS domain-containing protein
MQKSAVSAAPPTALTVNTALVDNIFMGVTEPKPWQTFMHQLRTLLQGRLASFRLYSYSHSSSRLSVTDSDPAVDLGKFYEEFLNRYQEASYLFDPAAPGQVLTFNDMIPREELLQGEFYRTFLLPHNLGDALRFAVAEPGGMHGWIDIGRAVDTPPFGDRERAFCLQLIPYLERALTIYSTLKHNEAEKQVYQAFTEQLTVGIFILDEAALVVRSNDMASQLLENTDDIAIRHQRLRFRDSALQKDFERVFKAAIVQRGKVGLPIGIEVLRIKQRDGGHIGLVVKAIPETRWCTGTGYPAVLVCICDPTRHEDARQPFVAQLFGLTPSEAALATLLADGMTLTEAAVKLKVTEHTTRAVSKRIFAKTGVNRQADLVRLILRSVALLK